MKSFKEVAAVLTILSIIIFLRAETKAAETDLKIFRQLTNERTSTNRPALTAEIVKRDGPAIVSDARSPSRLSVDISGAVAYVPTLGAKLAIALWLDVPARPQWWGAKCDGAALDTTAVRAAVSGAANARLRLAVSGTCLTGTVDVPSSTRIEAAQPGSGFKLATTTGPLLRVAAGADRVVVRGLMLDATNIDAAAVRNSRRSDGPGAVIYQPPGGNGGTIEISDTRVVGIYRPGGGTNALILNGAVARVTGNHVEATSGDALNFNGGFAYVAGNHVSQSGDGCIAFNNGARGVVIGNTLMRCDLAFGAGPEGHAADSDQVQSMVFANNTIEACRVGVNMGWYGYAEREGPVNWSVDNNLFRNCKQTAINYDGRATSWIANGTITGNVISHLGAKDYDGAPGIDTYAIRMVNAGGLTVMGNRIYDPRGMGKQEGIYLLNTPKSALVANSIQGGAINYNFAMWIIDSSDTAVTGNTVSAAQQILQATLTKPGARYGLNVSGNIGSDISDSGIVFATNGSGFTIWTNQIDGGTGVGSGIGLPVVASDFTVGPNQIRWAGKSAISDPPRRSWINWQIRGNNTGNGSQPAGAN